MTAADATKHCGGCNLTLPVASFSRNRSARDGLQTRCKGCAAACDAAWRAANSAIVRVFDPDATKRCCGCGQVLLVAHFSMSRSNRDGLQTRCKGCNAANGAAWRAANVDRHRAKGAAWRAANVDRHLANGAAWRAANVDRARATRAVYRQSPAGRASMRRRGAKRRAAFEMTPDDCRLTAEEWATIMDRCDHRCWVCGGYEEGPDGQPLPLEDGHIVPLSRGGLHTAANVRPMCAPCNRGSGGQHARPFHEWLPSKLSSPPSPMFRSALAGWANAWRSAQARVEVSGALRF